MAEIEYFYSAHSAFAYLGSARFMAIARAAGRRIAHKPIVVTDLRKDGYAICNIGPGLAVNVFLVIPGGSERPASSGNGSAWARTDPRAGPAD